MEFVTHSRAETEALGARLAGVLHGGAVVAFTGDLGAGKTAFVSGMAAALGVEAARYRRFAQYGLRGGSGVGMGRGWWALLNGEKLPG